MDATDLSVDREPLASTESERFVVNPHLCVTRCSEDEFLVRHGGHSFFSLVLSDERRTRMLGRVMDTFQRGGSLLDMPGWSSLTSEEMDVATSMRDTLVDRSVLVSPSTAPLAAYVQSLAGDPTTADRLAGTSVSVLADAGLGGPLAADLRAAGVEEVRHVDEGSGWDGSAPPLPSEEAVSKAFEGATAAVVVWSTFSPALFHRANQASLALEVPWLVGYVDGSEVVVGPSVFPGQTGCYLEYEVQAEAAYVQRDAYYLYREERSQPGNGHAPVVQPYGRVLTGFVSTVLLRMLMGATVPTVERVVHLDFERFAVDYQRFLRLPRCPACSQHRPSYRPTFL